jgi:hypothetical protein
VDAAVVDPLHLVVALRAVDLLQRRVVRDVLDVAVAVGAVQVGVDGLVEELLVDRQTVAPS